uniref:Uncharacterized protein n=1 Tax=Coccidioides posadasii RMSCC 3488 TaxID=454284 RepID=A0A0J6F2Q4_COCPO|nr:hypothetical protein CPAG_03496 [Coccidioides posadasii RMSCC 3488]
MYAPTSSTFRVKRPYIYLVKKDLFSPTSISTILASTPRHDIRKDERIFHRAILDGLSETQVRFYTRTKRDRREKKLSQSRRRRLDCS